MREVGGWINMSGCLWMRDKWHCVHTSTTHACLGHSSLWGRESSQPQPPENPNGPPPQHTDPIIFPAAPPISFQFAQDYVFTITISTIIIFIMRCHWPPSVGLAEVTLLLPPSPTFSKESVKPAAIYIFRTFFYRFCFRFSSSHLCVSNKPKLVVLPEKEQNQIGARVDGMAGPFTEGASDL